MSDGSGTTIAYADIYAAHAPTDAAWPGFLLLVVAPQRSQPPCCSPRSPVSA
jgi:hypothetical protein